MVPLILPSTLRAGTRDLPTVPPLAQYLIGCFLAPILAWVETALLRMVLLRCPDHPLLQIAHSYDLAPVVALCAHYYHVDGTKGAPPTYSVDLLVRAEIVRAWAASCSDRDLEWHLTSNLLVRAFVGLPLLTPAPDHSTLARFHAFLAQHHPDALFRDVLAFLDRLDPEDPATTPQIIDTFAMQTPAAWSPRAANLLLDLCADLFAAWQDHAPLALQSALPPLDLGPILHPARPRDALERQALLLQAVTLSQRLLADLTPHVPLLLPAARAAIGRLTDALAKVLLDEIQFDAVGYPTERTEKGDFRIISATDLEATFRKHDDDLSLGYNVALATTATRIRAVVALTGATPDSAAPKVLAEQQLANQQPLPPYFIMDRAGGWGKCRAQLDLVSKGQTSMVARTPSAGGADPARFGPADFQVDAERSSCTCPRGITSTKVYGHGKGDGVSFRFLASQCRDCPLWTECRGSESKPSSHRMVFISDYHSYVRQAAVFNQTAEGQALLGMRWRVEPTIAWLVRYQGCRRTRRVGQAAAQCQLFQACAVRNLLLWLSRVAQHQARQAA
jgi:DDE family transposase/transposase-like protein DUF772